MRERSFTPQELAQQDATRNPGGYARLIDDMANWRWSGEIGKVDPDNIALFDPYIIMDIMDIALSSLSPLERETMNTHYALHQPGVEHVAAQTTRKRVDSITSDAELRGIIARSARLLGESLPATILTSHQIMTGIKSNLTS